MNRKLVWGEELELNPKHPGVLCKQPNCKQGDIISHNGKVKARIGLKRTVAVILALYLVYIIQLLSLRRCIQFFFFNDHGVHMGETDWLVDSRGNAMKMSSWYGLGRELVSEWRSWEVSSSLKASPTPCWLRTPTFTCSNRASLAVRHHDGHMYVDLHMEIQWNLPRLWLTLNPSQAPLYLYIRVEHHLQADEGDVQMGGWFSFIRLPTFTSTYVLSL